MPTLRNLSASVDRAFVRGRNDPPIERATLSHDRPESSTHPLLEPPPGLLPVPFAAPGSYDERSTTFRSLSAFLRERPQRFESRERDVGTRWRDRGAIYRAAWIEATGELYVVQLGATERGGGHVELLAAGVRVEDLERAFAGWPAAQDRGGDSLGWLRDRVRRLRGVVKAATPERVARAGLQGRPAVAAPPRTPRRRRRRWRR